MGQPSGAELVFIERECGGMNAFAAASAVEARGMVALMPYLDEQFAGRVIRTAKGPLAQYLQETVGDVLAEARDGRVWSLELKFEEENKYGNLFLEDWSNRNLENLESHSQRGSNPGWLCKSGSQVLVYYFLKSDELFTCSMLKLKRWAFVSPSAARKGNPGRLWDFPAKPQGKYVQMNDTWARVVPISVLKNEVGLMQTSARQLSLALAA